LAWAESSPRSAVWRPSLSAPTHRRTQTPSRRICWRTAIPWEHMCVFYWVVKAILGPFLRIVFRPWADGADNVPREGPAIIASNPLSFSDPFFAPLPLPRKVVFLAKSEYFTGRGIKGLFSRAFFSGVGQIPVDRSGGEASERALNTGLRVLADGNLLGIYPEGTRPPDGRLFRGKTGVARLALESRASVVPCAMIDTFQFLPPGSLHPSLKIRPGVIFGAPMEFARYYGKESDRAALRAVTDEIMAEIAKLSGQEYLPELYAARAKELIAAANADKGDNPGAQTLPEKELPATLPDDSLQGTGGTLGLAHASGSADRWRRLSRT